MKPEDSKKMFQRSFICVLILVAGFANLTDDTAPVRICPMSAGDGHPQTDPLNSTSSQWLVIDIYTETAGRGTNASIGTYTIGDTIRVLISVNQNCTITEDLITPTGSVWLRMYGPVSSGTMVDYIDVQYPVGKWVLFVKAEVGNVISSDTAAFEVIDKPPFTSTRTYSLGNVTIIDEARFNGKVVRAYRYSVGGVYAWDVLVDRTYFGPEITNYTVRVQALAITYTPGYPPGYVDYSLTLGDEVEVYGLVSQKGNNTSVTLNGSENYYIKKLSTLCKSPEVILFAREVFATNLTVRIGGIAIPGSQNATITEIDWDWGDGQISDQQFPATHTYAKLGTYTILIRASQSDGLSTIKSLSITIRPNIPTETSAKTTLGEPELLATFLVTIAIALASVLTLRIRMRKRSKSSGPTTLGKIERSFRTYSSECAKIPTSLEIR